MGVEIGHHGNDSGVRNFLLMTPCLSFKRLTHTAALGATEANGRGGTILEIHLVKLRPAQRSRLIANASVAEVVQFDSLCRRKGRCGD